ncbi:uncharacterized protein LOC134694933 [Mytilus trossulus]|uniref:uncharacterized protein LOC134694933 n=1 Tax=Mytilus trossulus TaxID=6551 RepID=UPI003006BDEF
MSDFSSIISFSSVFQYFQLSSIVLTMVFGIIILIALPIKFLKQNHKFSNSLYLVLLIGFFHECFAFMTWLKSTYQLYGISPFVLDSYSFPVACFIFTLGVIFMTEWSKEELRTRLSTFIYGVYMSLVLLLVIVMGVLHSFSSQHHNIEFHKSDFFYSDRTDDNIPRGPVSMVEYKSCFVCCALEYVLIYAPVTFILLWNVTTCGPSGQQGQHHQQCMMCGNNLMVQRYILLFMLFVIWIVRPIVWIINFRYSFLSQDIIPSITMYIVYTSMLWHFLQQGFDKNNCIDDSCNHR